MLTSESCRVRWIGSRRRVAAALASFLVSVTTAVEAAPEWVLIYQRQIGNQINNGALTMETHVFREDGSKASGVGITNRAWPGAAIFGNTDSYGYNRVTFDPNNCGYDVTIFDPGTAKDYSATFYWQNPLNWPYHYSYVTHWLYVSDGGTIAASPNSPVYHYDLVSGMNRADGFNPGCQPINWQEAPGANSDQRELAAGGWSVYQAQTFVVPPNVDRIISAQAWLTRSAADPPFYYWASIHQGGPTGTQIGPRVTSPRHHSVNFKEETVCWPLQGVPVTPGQTYALRLEPTDGAGCNVWRTAADNYAGGSLWNGATQVAGHDMVAVVVGIGMNPPRIQLSKTSIAATAMEDTNVADPHSFTITNIGGGSLDYVITEDAEFLDVSPGSGTSTGEADHIDLVWNTAGLDDGEYAATITVSAQGAANTPQHVAVSLTVQPALYAFCDFNQDGDVDQEDFGTFQVCYTGAGVPQDNSLCTGARLDLDEDVDQEDFLKFMGCFRGPGISANPDCAD